MTKHIQHIAVDEVNLAERWLLSNVFKLLPFPDFLFSFFKQLNLFLFIYVCVCHLSASAHKGQMRMSDSLELEVVNFPV